MAKKKPTRVFRTGRVSAAEADRLNEIRRKVMDEFPPDPNRARPAQTGIAAQIRHLVRRRQARQHPQPRHHPRHRYGRDAKLSNIEAVAAALGLRLELTRATV